MNIESQQILKKDHIIISYKQIINEIERMGIFALSYNGTTHVIQSIWKTQLDIPILEYYETMIFPKVLVENIYVFETMMKRNLSLKKNAKYQPYPQRIQPINTANPTDPQKDFTNNIIIQEISPDLIDLEITIKAYKYMSVHPHEKLLKIIEIMTSF